MHRDEKQRLAEASNVLLLGSMLDDSTKQVHNMLLSPDTSEPTDILVLTFRSPDQWLRAWAGDPATHEGRIGIITLDESPSEPGRQFDDVTTVSVNPADLTGIGMKLSDYLSSRNHADTETVICVESITELLQYTNRKSLFRFLRVITRRIEHVEGIAHFHLDPAAHDQETVNTIKLPFDAIVDIGGPDEKVTVSTRY
ncbi:DUF7504 family protein [Natrinema marinum]|uniref:DUF7504 family protein n=1 Tax=Natrinema marinum TaxID=2961598 RepID=UPI0020C8506B|nr:hypothetical protein [Natrinema marinum]